MKLGTMALVGPLELADHIGLDICFNATEMLHPEMDNRYKPSYLPKRNVKKDDLGRKLDGSSTNMSDVPHPIHVGVSVRML